MSRLPATKRRRLSPPEDALKQIVAEEENVQLTVEEQLDQYGLRWNLEQDYERRPRKKGSLNDSVRLPIKTPEGRIEQAPVRVREPVKAVGTISASLKHDQDSLPEVYNNTYITSPQAVVRTTASVHELITAKEELARLAMAINESPEENIKLLQTLGQISSSSDVGIRKLGLATQMAVYKDLLPAYRIRPVLPNEMKEKLSKDVRKLRNFEQSIVGSYKGYVTQLAEMSSSGKGEDEQPNDDAAVLAVSCVAGMVNAAPHFNFRTELLRILVSKLSGSSSDAKYHISCRALAELFKNDDDGHASFEAVTMLAKMIKVRNYHVDEHVLNLFLHLRLLKELHTKGSDRKIDKPELLTSDRNGNSKKGREFRTKSQRKLERERKKIGKEMEEADATVSHEQRDQIQAETLKVVFGVYLRILKERVPHLMGAVLEGLVKYAHLINQDFFGDLLESLKDLLRENEEQFSAAANVGVKPDEVADMGLPDIPHDREILLCVVTAFSLLQGQDATFAAQSLNLDLSFFITQLYHSLYRICLSTDIEKATSPIGGSTSTSMAKVNMQTIIVLLLRSLRAVMLPSNTRSASPTRMAAFVKKILTSALQLPEKSCIAVMGLLLHVTKTHQKRIAPLWNTEERKGDGVYDPLNADVEACNPFASTAWDGELLRYHYVPSIQKCALEIEATIGSNI